ncbi:head-tail connector protein [Desulfosporosinus fructosivorans]
MNLIVITPPAAEPLTLTEAKQHLRVDGSADDTLITSLIKQAREWCEDYQGKKYITQILELVLDTFPDGDYIEFRNCSPVQSVTSVKYTDKDGVEATLAATEYIQDKDSFVNKIMLGYSKQWPTTILQPVNAVRVRFVAGYTDAAAVPESVKWAMVLHMRLLYHDYRPDERERLERARDALLGMNRVVPV